MAEKEKITPNFTQVTINALPSNRDYEDTTLKRWAMAARKKGKDFFYLHNCADGSYTNIPNSKPIKDKGPVYHYNLSFSLLDKPFVTLVSKAKNSDLIPDDVYMSFILYNKNYTQFFSKKRSLRNYVTAQVINRMSTNAPYFYRHPLLDSWARSAHSAGEKFFYCHNNPDGSITDNPGRRIIKDDGPRTQYHFIVPLKMIGSFKFLSKKIDEIENPEEFEVFAEFNEAQYKEFMKIFE